MESRSPNSLPSILESQDFVLEPETKTKNGFLKNGEANSSTLRIPLLTYKHSVMCLQKEGTASLQSAIFNLSNTMIGAGVMSLPYAINQLGVIPGVFALVFVSFLTHASIMSMLRCAEGASQISYSQIVVEALGKWGRFVLQFSIVVNNFGLLTVFLIIVGDVFCDDTGLLASWFGDQGDLFSKAYVLSFTVLILCFLSFFEKMDSLRITSQISVFLSLMFVLTTIGLSLLKIGEGSAYFPPFFSSEMSLYTTFSVINVINNAFICHFNIMPIYRELKSANISRMQIVVRSSLSCCTAIYAVVGVFAVVLFGSETSSDVLENFDDELASVTAYWYPITTFVKAGYAISRILTFPLILFSLRITLDSWVTSFRGPGGKPRFVILTLLILLLSLVAAVLIPNIWTVFQITGCTAAVVIGFILPGLIGLHTIGAITTPMQRVEAYALVVLGILAGVIGVTVNVVALV